MQHKTHTQSGTKRIAQRRNFILWMQDPKHIKAEEGDARQSKFVWHCIINIHREAL